MGSKLREEVSKRKIRWTRPKEKRNIELGVNWETSYETDEEYEASIKDKEEKKKNKKRTNGDIRQEEKETKKQKS